MRGAFMKLEPHEKLKIWRQRRKFTQEGLAAKTACSQMEISRLERGKIPNPELRNRIEKVLNVTIWSDENEKEGDFKCQREDQSETS